ncbi:MAG: ABC transporter ATP-binding protein [Myxococcota bacterium]
MGDSQLLRQLAQRVLSNHRTVLFGGMILYIPVTLLALAQPLVIGAAVDQGMQQHDVGVVAQWAGVYLGVVVCCALVEILQLQLVQLAGQRILRDLRHQLFAKAQRLPMAFFSHTPLGKTLARITNDTQALGEVFSTGAVAIVSDALFVGSTLIMLLLVDIHLSWSVLVWMPALALGMWLFRTWTQTAYHRVRSTLAQLSGTMQECLAGTFTTQLFGQTQKSCLDFQHHNNAHMHAYRRAVLLDAAVYSFVDAMSFVTTASVLWFAYGQKQLGALKMGILIAFIEALGRFFQPLRELSNRYTVFQSALVCTRRILQFLHLKEEESPKRAAPAIKFTQKLSFENVCFSYGEENVRVLNNVSFSVNKGESIALVGQTGAGKTTITKLLYRLYDVTDGKICLDGIDIRQFSLPSLRHLFNIVPQEVSIMSATVRDNLCYGCPTVTSQQVWRAIQQCQIQGLIERLGGLDAHINAQGENFSMGERQLLALCRALIANSEILILDEATANVDPYTEKHLQIATEKLLTQRTCFIVAHRLNTISRCDRILVFHEGYLIQQGRHKELLKCGGTYSKLYQLQQQQELLQTV